MRAEIIRTKILEIGENIRVVKQNLPKNFKNFRKLGIIKDGIYKKIEFCIQNLLDIATIIVFDLNLGIPSDEEDIIEKLYEKKLVSKKLTEKLRKMRGFRNFLVHRYGRIDDKIAFNTISKNLRDFHSLIRIFEKISRKYKNRPK